MKLIDTVDMLTNVRVVDSHYITIYEGNPIGMVNYFSNNEKTMDYLNCVVEEKIFRDYETIIYLGRRVDVEDLKAKNIFNLLKSICKAFNDNLKSINCNYNLNEIFRGEYMGIQLAAACFEYSICVTHICGNCMNPISNISITKNGIILFEEDLIC